MYYKTGISFLFFRWRIWAPPFQKCPMVEQGGGQGPLSDLLVRADELCRRVDPETTPYRSKYEARDLLRHYLRGREAETAAAAVDASSSSSSSSSSLESRENLLLNRRLGTIAYATEEFHEADKKLTPLAELLVPGIVELADALGEDGDGSTPSGNENGTSSSKLVERDLSGLALEMPEEAVHVLNTLGVLWTQRGHSMRGLLYLKASERVCEEGEAGVQLTALQTHAFFYLAQVYGALGETALSCKYCSVTLQRQLEAHVKGDGARLEFDATEWARNAWRLSDFYMAKSQTKDAAICLLAARRVVERWGDPSVQLEIEAELEKRLARVYILVMQLAVESWELQEGEEISMSSLLESQPGGKAPPAPDFSAGGVLLEGPLAPPLCDPEAIPHGFEGMRELFKLAQSHLHAALRYYELDGFVTDHTRLQQDVSRAYRYLATVEPDPKRRQAMLGRRCQALEPLLKALSRQAYEALHKELSFEAGEVYTSMLEIKEERIRGKLELDPAYRASRAEILKVAEMADAGLQCFDHFVDMYKGVEVDVDEIRPYLRARLYRARLLSKQRAPDAPLQSQQEYQWLVDNAPNLLKRLPDPSCFQQELQLAKEMSGLLIAKMEQERAAAQR
jgi:hypothetical protein